MKRAPFRVSVALGWVLALGLATQSGAWLALQVRSGPLLVLGVAAWSVVCFGVGLVLLRRAFAPLATQTAWLALLEERLRKGDAQSLPHGVPDRDQALRELEQLGERVSKRLLASQRMRVQVEEASAYKAGFLRAVRHELRTPLNSILGFAEVLLSDIEGPLTASQRENLVVIQRTGKRLQDLFEEVIELATVTAGQVELELDAVDAPGLLEQVCSVLEEERGDRPVHIRVDADERLPPLAGDPYRLRQMLQGMASHALAVSTGELLVLGASPARGSVRLFVRDPGRQLSSLELSALLARESVATRRKGLDESSRLRVNIWRELAQIYGGRFELCSDAHGTTFALELPEWRAS